ncbi:MAG: GBS Bsp-like repeat-containing protein [Lachnospiraceae bacterium]|nr:GBS Bsp-like repeat-containing protein [Lachnospiraceae bacterium]
MRYLFKRRMAFLLAGVLIIQSLLPVQAAEATADNGQFTSGTQAVSDNGLQQEESADGYTDDEGGSIGKTAPQDGIGGTGVTGDTADEPANDAQTGEEGDEPANGALTEGEREDAADDTLSEDADDEPGTDGQAFDEALLDYLYVESPYISTPGTQRIVAAIGDGTVTFDEASVIYENYRTGEIFEAAGKVFEEEPNLLLFEKEFTDQAESGIYQIKSITVRSGNAEKTIALETAGIYAYFGVNEEVTASSEPVPASYELDTNIVTIDENGQTEAASDITEALELAQAQLGDTQLARAGKAKKNVIVVLDPGHDGTHLGAHASGLKEEELVLKIAQYCKAELEEYSGVTVYMTRNSMSCPYPGTISTACNSNRVAYAKSVGADVYVSIHLNSSPSASASGAEVYYPNSSYNANIGSAGKQLAESIQKNLAALGLSNRGVKVRNSGDGSTYPDGSLADYYGVIKNSKLNGFPGIIIEHAFLTNASDAALLSSESGLQKIGVADAEGIANYFSLQKGDTASFTSSKIKITDVDLLAGTFAASISDIKPAKDVAKVQFRVYTKEDQSDLKVYNAKKQSDGSYKATIYASKHNNVEGTYIVRAYVLDEDGNSAQVADTTQQLVPSFKAKLSAEVTGENNTTYKLSADGISGASSVRFLFYYKKDGKSKGVYYKGKKNKSGVWTASVPLKKMANEGAYKVYVYATAAYGEEKQAGTKTFTYEREMSVTVKATNKKQQKFKVTAGGLAYASKVEYEVYSKTGGKDDLRTYKATKNDEGAWVYNVPVKNHKTAGKYYVTVYATIGGKRINIGKKTFSVSGPTDGKATVSYNSVKGTMTVSVKNVTSVSWINKVTVKAWTKKNQSDAKTFDAKLKKGVYTVTIKLSKFQYYYGKYNIEVIATDNNKITRTVATKKPKIQPPEVQPAAALNKAKTKYKVTVPDISYAKSVEIRVWRKGEGEKKAKVYHAKKDSDGNWCYSVPTKTFTKTGVHYFKAYATLGTKAYAVGTASAKITSVDKPDASGYYTIMGDGDVTLDQMMRYYKANASYPSFYQNSDAPTLKKFCQLYIKECETEGVKVEVAFAQAMKETNFLKYGGDVSIEQYNFAGIGATGGGVKGNSFPNVQTGIRAQVQHLKAYASEEPLVNEVVDPRFEYVTRGICPYVEWLGINENPNHVGWATAVGYGTNIVERIGKLKSY